MGNSNLLHLGLDIGSTTVKLVALDTDNNKIYSRYERHYSDIKQTVSDLLTSIYTQGFEGLKELKIPDLKVTMCITGSSGIMLAQQLGVEFVQEVIACSRCVEHFFPKTDVAIELGGEDAKITYFGNTPELRMNGVCAGGTGAFIDQMASLLNTDAHGLNQLAKNYKEIYPIASRCGVFAKTDVQSIINEGAAKEDIAASIFQAVVSQTIGGLACGKPIRGNVAFLGGPLYFLSELREQFSKTLKLKPENIITPDDAQVFVAKGAALMSRELNREGKIEAFYFKRIIKSLQKLEDMPKTESHLKALFETAGEYEEFKQRHSLNKVARKKVEEAKPPFFLGIDAGSTTTKLALTDSAGALVYWHYGSNGASPLNSTIAALNEMYSSLPENIQIAGATVTGYGESLIKAALKIDYGEIETMAHYKGAEHFLKGVDFILDIGGQDMKCLKIRQGIISEISLNEACSSGCGSFIETLAKSLGITLEQFVQMGLMSAEPVDLGTRCTVFMNSKIKQAQKEGADVGSIAAGIAISVVKNALYKVIRLHSAAKLGEKIVVQGGTFLNDAVLRSFEYVVGCQVVRPDIAGIMGAFGAALIARDKRLETRAKTAAKEPRSTMLGKEELKLFSLKNTTRFCGLCGNNCLLTASVFSDGREFIIGNRCERGAGKEQAKEKAPNLFAYKYNRLFNYRPLAKEAAPRGEIGIPRVLNMYEHYPFWFTFFTELGYRVVLSENCAKNLNAQGQETIASESICYPAKLSHSHIFDLLSKGVKTIFYPCLPREEKEHAQANNNYNCPIVTSYPEVLSSNIDRLKDKDVKFIYPFLPINDLKRLKVRLYEEFKEFNISKGQIKNAVDKAYAERESCRRDIKRKAEEILAWLEENNRKGIILTGRPYHLDPQVNHGIPELIAGLGFAVLTEESVAHLGKTQYPLRVLDQWVYHSRAYAAASFATARKDVEVVQLNSFGCGLDAIASDQVQEILQKYQKSYTLIKIDEIKNLGAARIRIRSLIAALNEKERQGIVPQRLPGNWAKAVFTEQMRKNYTILSPQMSPIHFPILKEVFNLEGYNLEIIPEEGMHVVEEGLLHVHNDACYPVVIVVGQLMTALKSGRYDLERVASIMFQTGGGCRASNYIGIIRKALKEAGFGQIPVISLNTSGLEKHPGFKISFSLLKKAIMALLYGDLLMNLTYSTRPYEKNSGETNALLHKWVNNIRKVSHDFSKDRFKDALRQIISEYQKIEVLNLKKPKVGVVGEIMVKLHPFSNNFLVDTIEKEGGEAIVPGLTNFFLGGLYDDIYEHKKLAGTFKDSLISKAFIWWVERYQKLLRKEAAQNEKFNPYKSIYELADITKNVMHLGHQTGEGWCLTGEMLEFIEAGVENILCLQPFACLPNHIIGKGMIRELKRRHPRVNILPLDYDSGVSHVNQLNRIKLMMSTAFKNLEGAI